jgi:hypothetical protein
MKKKYYQINFVVPKETLVSLRKEAAEKLITLSELIRRKIGVSTKEK